MLAPRTTQLALQLKKRNRELEELSEGAVSLQLFWGGSAGDERTVLRKMRSGQLDGSAFTLNTVSEFVREALVLESPALCLQYAQLDALRAELTPRFEQEALHNGFRILLWGDFGRLRYFSKRPIRTPQNFRRVRPWLLPNSPVMRELYRMLGATGIPLELAEVYGAMETGMIDTFWATSMIASLMQWHRTAHYVSPPMGFINGALVFTQRSLDDLPEHVSAALETIVDREARVLQKRFRENDARAHKRLLARGYEELSFQKEETWWRVGHDLRKRLVGRAYTRALLRRAEGIALRHADPQQRAAFKSASNP